MELGESVVISALTAPTMLYGCSIFLQGESHSKNYEEEFEMVRYVEIFIYDGISELIERRGVRCLRERHSMNVSSKQAKFKNSRIAP
jgi:exonuclease I